MVATGGFNEPTGTLMSPMGPFVFTRPVLGSTFQPCTSSPVAVVSFPAALVWKFPARVYMVAPAEFVTTKKPSP